MTVSGVVLGLVLALSTSCGGSAGDRPQDATAGDSARSKSSVSSRPPSVTGPDPRVHRHSGAYDLVLQDVSVVQREAHDRVVLRFAGTGRPGWAARFVAEAVLEGSGRIVDLDGDTILRLDITGTPTRASVDDAPVRTRLGGDVVDLRASGAWEGMTHVFIGLRGGRGAYRIDVRATPARLVVDLG